MTDYNFYPKENRIQVVIVDSVSDFELDIDSGDFWDYVVRNGMNFVGWHIIETVEEFLMSSNKTRAVKSIERYLGHKN